ncbi:MAG TPA: DUF4386 domain-containing protein [Myxococcaceae bacterium]|nr:DUF4386 domain-containing protein [Myxococcaceae bacterium]
MTLRTNDPSPRAWARWAGGLALALVVLGPFSMLYVPSTVVVPGDAGATAARIAASESLFRAGILSDTAICLIEVVLTGFLYVLFKPVSAARSFMAATARLAMTVIQGTNVALSAAVLLVLGGAGSMSALAPAQWQAFALLLLGAHEQVVHVWESFFALHCLLLGLLVYRSGFVPRLFGPLMAMAGVGYLANGMGNLLAPGSKAVLASVVTVTAIFGELPLFLWFTVKAVDAEAWRKLAAGPPGA